MISCTDKVKQRWDLLIISCVIFNAFSVPMDIAFTPPSMETSEFKIFSVFVDFLYFIDIVICFRTTFVDDSGREISEPRLIAKKYLMGSFSLDLIAGLPLEYIMNHDENNDDLTLKLQGLLKLGRLLRINRIIRFLNARIDLKAGA